MCRRVHRGAGGVFRGIHGGMQRCTEVHGVHLGVQRVAQRCTHWCTVVHRDAQRGPEGCGGTQRFEEGCLEVLRGVQRDVQRRAEVHGRLQMREGWWPLAAIGSVGDNMEFEVEGIF